MNQGIVEFSRIEMDTWTLIFGKLMNESIKYRQM